MDYCNGVQGFINFATSIPRNFTDGGIRCPCRKCKNLKFLHQDVVMMHLLTKGFMQDYLCWYAHGELFVPNESMVERAVGSTSSASNMHEVGNENSNPYRNMVMDAMRMSEGNASEFPNIEEEPNADTTRFFDLLKDSDEPLWDGCTNHCKLSAVAQVFTIKSNYWKTNLLRHNLDVMHIEKNVFENIFNTVMDVKGKTKDNIKARLDVALFCNRKNMELVCDGSRVAKPRASFVLEKNAQLLVYKWLKSLRFPDGHASNISRLVNTEECRLYGMKSHDCHVFMQTLIPLAFRDLLPKGIWDALTEISHFFRDICSSKLNVDHIERLEKNIVETICKLEMIFPPSFFDSMEHLPVHLSFEVKVGGPVQYRWMYPFERLDITVATTFIIKCFYFYFNVFN
jgi:hypothetical protein